MGQEPLDLGCREGLPVERHLHPEVEQRIHSHLRGCLTANRSFHLQACRAVHPPAHRHSDNHTGAFERRNVLQELERLLRAPAQCMEDLARSHQGLQPRAVLGGALDGHEQREQALAVSCPCVLLQGLSERKMLRLGLSRKSCRISRKKSEGGLLISPVLSKVEMHTSNQVPGWMAAFEEVLHRELGVSAFGIKRRIQGSPKIP